MDIGDDATVADFTTKVLEKYPKLDAIKESMVLGLNMDYVSLDSDRKIRANDELAFIPPIRYERNVCKFIVFCNNFFHRMKFSSCL